MKNSKGFFLEKAPELLAAFENIKKHGVFTLINCNGFHFDGIDSGSINFVLNGVIPNDASVGYAGHPLSCFLDLSAVIEKIKKFIDDEEIQINHFQCAVESKPWKGARRKSENKFVTPKGLEYKLSFNLTYKGCHKKQGK